ncbi:hypothetical protein F4821DRAFT_275413 [Hypoxylon rubiginosum]|uniref:Uncharacterized protein n=1 Tax=Hypoxylon rubiginosum TaxID=110542 RepID=A0ACC0CKU8_9PEZI|nr:hypothetical protein F4821DRAFT_275413 [Hypoxylon rubiginosum]
MASIYSQLKHNDLRAICMHRALPQGSSPKKKELLRLLKEQDENGRPYEKWSREYLRLEYDNRDLAQFPVGTERKTIAETLRKNDEAHPYAPPPLEKLREFREVDDDSEDDDDDSEHGDDSDDDGGRAGSGRKRRQPLTPPGQTPTPGTAAHELPTIQAPISPISRGQTGEPTAHSQSVEHPKKKQELGPREDDTVLQDPISRTTKEQIELERIREECSTWQDKVDGLAIRTRTPHDMCEDMMEFEQPCN